MSKKQCVNTFSLHLTKNVLTFNFRLGAIVFYSSHPIFVNIMQTFMVKFPEEY